MCTYILYHDPDSPQPVMLASVRNERLERKTRLPSQADWTFPETYIDGIAASRGRLRFNFGGKDNDFSAYTKAGIIAPQDADSNSTFAGINKYGVVSTINNLDIPINFSKDKLNRGGLVLDTLTFPNAKTAAETIYALLTKRPRIHGKKGVPLAASYPSFSLIVADKDNAYIIQNASADVEPVIHSTLQRQAKSMDGYGAEKIVVSLERIPPRTAVISCGWGVNDNRSGRTKRFLPAFQKLFSDPASTPTQGNLHSWGALVGCMMERIRHKGDTHDDSITQPPYERCSPDGRERKWCATLSTALFMVHKEGEKAVADMFFSPSPPNTERPMGFQAFSSDPKRYATEADLHRLEWDEARVPHTNMELTLKLGERRAEKGKVHYHLDSHHDIVDQDPKRFIPGEEELNEQLKHAKTQIFNLDRTEPMTALTPSQIAESKPPKKKRD